MAEVDLIEQVVAEVRRSKKYRAVCEEMVRRIAVEEWAKRGRTGQGGKQAIKAATKATRARLHQVYAAYESPVDYERAIRDLEAAYAMPPTEAGAAVREACRTLLARHTSTRERLPILGRIYAELWAHTGVPRVLLDLACGLNPLAVPFMGLGEGTVYHGYDIDEERVAFLECALPLAGVDARMHLQDVLCAPPAEGGDVALLMKSSACLERQRAGATLELLDALRVRYVVVTFPVQSLGRRQKGMAEHYERTFRAQTADRAWPVVRLMFESELVFIVDKGDGHYREAHGGGTEGHGGGRGELGER
jgi:16S rRNA (guanine(1405)-N(7))-methyltransferase